MIQTQRSKTHSCLIRRDTFIKAVCFLLFRRPQHNSPLCWLTWHNHVSSGQFLVNAGWDLRNETWLGLPGKTQAAETFINALRQQVIHQSPIGRWVFKNICPQKIIVCHINRFDIRPDFLILKN